MEGKCVLIWGALKLKKTKVKGKVFNFMVDKTGFTGLLLPQSTNVKKVGKIHLDQKQSDKDLEI